MSMTEQRSGLPIEAAMAKELEALRAKHRYRMLPLLGGGGRHIEAGGRMLLNLSSNDYLGLGADRALLAAWAERHFSSGASDMPAFTSSSSRLLTGNHPLYGELESALAQAYGAEAALCFNSGYHANTGILPALAGRHDLILCDRLNHASIIDGIRIAEAEYRRYRHADLDHLEHLLDAASGRYRQVFVVTESVFSMDGDLVDLRRLVDLKRKHGALLIVDEAHGAGVFGERGLGLAESLGLTGEVDILIGTFGKAYASAGAYAVMRGLFREYLVNTMRTLIFTTALPPALLAWSIEAFRTQLGMQEARKHLSALSSRLRDGLRSAGFEVPGQSQIVPVLLGGDRMAVEMAARLREDGFHALPVRPPTVPENSARLRFSLRADLRFEEIDALCDTMARRRP
jgi:8-amino-7-oxononanoate synthase